MELANLQLAELEAYDRILDDSLDRAYRDLAARPLSRRGQILRELREIRIDLARFSDELSNITKFFGDWHLAHIYENISCRFTSPTGIGRLTKNSRRSTTFTSFSTTTRPTLDADSGNYNRPALRD